MAACKIDPCRFNDRILNRPPYWSKQREICESIVKFPVTAVKSGNGTGKSFVLGGIVSWFSTLHRSSRTVVCAPTEAQLSGVLWREIVGAFESAERHGIPTGAKFRGLAIEFGANHLVEGYGGGSSIESKSGRHAGDLLAVIDEASGVEHGVHEAIDSLNPSRRLYAGNPLRPEGKFYEICELSHDNPNINVIEISSLESPHAHLQRSPFGMADAGFIENARHEYGEESLWWACHVLGKFPGEMDQALLLMAWLNLAAQTLHVRKGPVRLGVDIAKGLEGDQSMIVARDDAGILNAWWSRVWDLETLAKQTRLRALELDVRPAHITFDETGIGTDFANRLKAVGIEGAKGFMGSHTGGEKFGNLRSMVAWAFRRRLDPGRAAGTTVQPKPEDRLQWQQRSRLEPKVQWSEQNPFSIPRELLNTFRKELQGCRYSLDGGGRIELERKENFVKRIKSSPNFLDAIAMTFAYPHA
jgi:phage terminase large subunit